MIRFAAIGPDPMSMNASLIRILKTALAAAAALSLVACASKPPPPIPEAPSYWSFERTVSTDRSIITLFDPADLRQHFADPVDWHQYDFAVQNDLETGRLIAVSTDQVGDFRIKFTDAPLTDAEAAAAGASAEFRLRVINYRLLLAGGEAWPSEAQQVRIDPGDDRWIPFDNGDYRVTATVLDSGGGHLHDYVFQFESVPDMSDIPHISGVPQLVIGQPLGVLGLNSTGLPFSEQCNRVQKSAEWSPLQTRELPLPGSYGDIALADALHARGLSLQSAGRNARVPVVVASGPNVGKVGIYVSPLKWNEVKAGAVDSQTAYSHVLCAVRILTSTPGVDTFNLEVEILPAKRGRLSANLARDLASSFSQWARVSSDPAWRFKSEMVVRAKDDHSLIMSVLNYMSLATKDTEKLLLLPDIELANRLLALLQEWAAAYEPEDPTFNLQDTPRF